MGLIKMRLGLILAAALPFSGWADVSSSGKLYRVRGDERYAARSLRQFGSVEVTFKCSDSDQNAVNDYWVGDISGLYRINPENQEIRMIELRIAEADAAPWPKSKLMGDRLVKRPVPARGYLFQVIPEYEIEPGTRVKYDQGGGFNVDRFGICCCPADYGNGARRTFIVSEGGTIYSKDTRGKPAAYFPLDPIREGWKRLD